MFNSCFLPNVLKKKRKNIEPYSISDDITWTTKEQSNYR